MGWPSWPGTLYQAAGLGISVRPDGSSPSNLLTRSSASSTLVPSWRVQALNVTVPKPAINQTDGGLTSFQARGILMFTASIRCPILDPIQYLRNIHQYTDRRPFRGLRYGGRVGRRLDEGARPDLVLDA